MKTANESVKKEVITNHDMRNKEWIEFTESIATNDNKLKKNVDKKKRARRKQIMWVKNNREDTTKKGRKYELKTRQMNKARTILLHNFFFPIWTEIWQCLTWRDLIDARAYKRGPTNNRLWQTNITVWRPPMLYIYWTTIWVLHISGYYDRQ